MEPDGGRRSRQTATSGRVRHTRAFTSLFATFSVLRVARRTTRVLLTLAMLNFLPLEAFTLFRRHVSFRHFLALRWVRAERVFLPNPTHRAREP
jgi:hypothetical protein